MKMTASASQSLSLSSASRFAPIFGPSYLESEDRKTLTRPRLRPLVNRETTSAIRASSWLWLIKTRGLRSSPSGLGFFTTGLAFFTTGLGFFAMGLRLVTVAPPPRVRVRRCRAARPSLARRGRIYNIGRQYPTSTSRPYDAKAPVEEAPPAVRTLKQGGLGFQLRGVFEGLSRA